jgi:hypothetical protein
MLKECYRFSGPNLLVKSDKRVRQGLLTDVVEEANVRVRNTRRRW